MTNVAGYIMTLRQAKGLSRKRLAELVDSTEMSILRIEKQGQEPSGPLLVRLIDTLGGSWDVVSRLIKSDDDDALERALAETPGGLEVRPDLEARFNRLLELMEQGVSPEEAARRVRFEP